jgi:pantetheine-phosphate adenylyltransferase
MFRKVVIGGTYDMLHKGHERVLDAGFQIGDSVAIGLTSDEFAMRFRAESVSPYEKRKAALEKYVAKYDKPYKIIKIDDSYGVATIDRGHRLHSRERRNASARERDKRHKVQERP